MDASIDMKSRHNGYEPNRTVGQTVAEWGSGVSKGLEFRALNRARFKLD